LAAPDGPVTSGKSATSSTVFYLKNREKRTILGTSPGMGRETVLSYA